MPKTGSWGDPSHLLAEVGVPEDRSFHEEFTGENEKAVLTVPIRIQDAWAKNDADAFADVFSHNGSLLLQDTQLTSREQIREHMAAGFRGALRGARVAGRPLSVGFLEPDIAVAVTEGGIIRPGASTIAPEDHIRAVWVITRRPDGRLELVSHQSSPIAG